MGESRALPKFLRAVDWRDAREAAEALGLMRQWGPIDCFDALELLSGEYPNVDVRAFAVARIAETEEEELAILMPQLVQALRFDGGTSQAQQQDEAVLGRLGTGLSSMESGRASVEMDSDRTVTPASGSSPEPVSALEARLASGAQASASGSASTGRAAAPAPGGPLERLLLDRSCTSVRAASLLHWHLTALWEDPRDGPRYVAVHSRFYERLQEQHPRVLDAIRRQRELVAVLSRIAADIKGMRATADRRTDRLRGLIGPGGPFEELTTLRAPLPTDPAYQVVGVVVEECSVFKSAMVPLRITFRLESGTQTSIYKQGDDLRQAGADSRGGWPTAGLALS